MLRRSTNKLKRNAANASFMVNQKIYNKMWISSNIHGFLIKYDFMNFRESRSQAILYFIRVYIFYEWMWCILVLICIRKTRMLRKYLKSNQEIFQWKWRQTFLCLFPLIQLRILHNSRIDIENVFILWIDYRLSYHVIAT